MWRDERFVTGIKGLMLFWTMLTAVMLYANGTFLARQLAISVQGQQTTAALTTCEMSIVGRGGAHPVVTYTFTLNNTTYSGQDSLPGRDCALYHAGDVYRIEYFVSDPAQSRILKSGTPAWQILLMFMAAVICGLPIVGFMVLFGWYLLRSAAGRVLPNLNARF